MTTKLRRLVTVGALVMLVIGWIAVCTEMIGQKRSLQDIATYDYDDDDDIKNDLPATYTDEDGVCVNALPYGKMNDSNIREVLRYQKQHIDRAGGKALSYDRDPPEYVILPPGSSVAHWDCRGKVCPFPNPNGINILKGSAWTADGKEAFEGGKVWFPHKDYEFLAKKRTVIKGDAAAFFGFFPTNFGHCLHDNFPLIAWLRSVVPDHTVFILPDTNMYRKLLDFIDPTFIDRIHFSPPNEIVTIEEGTLTVPQPDDVFLADYGNTLFRHLRHWIFEQHPEQFSDDEKTIVFYTRGGPHTEHGRALEAQHEQDILALIHSNMERYNRKEKLVMFSGQDDEGKILPLAEQFDIFRRASTIIGPHGSGLANNIWTHPFPTDCNERVQMLEFVSGVKSQSVQNLYNGYYWVMRGMPIDWHQVVYASNSTRFTTYIDLGNLQLALDDMWGSTTQ